MPNDQKKRISLAVGGKNLTLITDESADFVAEVEASLNEKIKALMKASFRISAADAALMCAIDTESELLRAHKRLEELESELAAARESEELLREQLLTAQPPQQPSGLPPSRESKIAELERYLETKKKDSAEKKASREEKIRQIEALLRERESNT